MSYLDRISLPGEADPGSYGTCREEEPALYVTDDFKTAQKLKKEGHAVLIYLHEGNMQEDFSEFMYAVEDPGEIDREYAVRVYQRLKGLPWKITETARCLIRETVPEDVDVFYEIYSHPEITRYMEDLYPEKEQEKQYVREYIEKVYSYYEFGIWTVVEREKGEVIGRAGFALREGYEDPELGFIIGVPWQRKGYGEEVCRAVMEYGQRRLGFSRVRAMVDPRNGASLRLCGRLGFLERERVLCQGKEYVRLEAVFNE